MIFLTVFMIYILNENVSPYNILSRGFLKDWEQALLSRSPKVLEKPEMFSNKIFPVVY